MRGRTCIAAIEAVKSWVLIYNKTGILHNKSAFQATGIRKQAWLSA
jgi:hypothetical protein